MEVLVVAVAMAFLAPTLAWAQGATGVVSITSEPPGAGVIVNNRRVGVTPLELSLPGGKKVSVALELIGFERFEEGVTPSPGETVRVHGVLVPPPADAPPPAPDAAPIAPPVAPSPPQE